MPAVECRGARDSALNPYALPWHPRSYWYQLCVAYEERAGDMHNIRAVDVEENAGGCLESGSGTGPQQRARAPTIITASPTPTGEGQGPPAWAQCSETRGKVLRVLDELVWWFNETGREQYTPEVPVAEADTAEDVKQYFLKYYPRGRPGGWGQAISQALALWNRISLQHLRFGGSRVWYVVVHTLDGAHRLLVLKVPPSQFESEAERWEHASRQVTYRDDRQGRFQPGLRVHDSFLTCLTADELEFARAYVEGGHAYQFTEVPRTFRGENYASYEEHAERAHAEILRQVAAGWLEGPLHFAPRITHSQAGVYLPEKDKFRPVTDASRSGLNRAIKPEPCELDTVRKVVKRLKRDDRQGGFDLKDAFYLWPRRQEHCDYQGVKGPRSHPHFYRLRFLPMGASDSPGLQQRWAEIIKQAINRTVLAPRAQQWGGTAQDAEVAGMYVDDGKVRISSRFSKEQADNMFGDMVAFLERHGVEDSAKKRELPDTQGGYLGMHLDTQRLEASLPEEKAVKYAQAVADLLSSAQQSGDSTVSRRALARVTGKLQFAADVARELQGVLPTLYRARDKFARPPGQDADPWAEHVRVRVGKETVAALERCRSILQCDYKLRRKWYDDEDTDLAGFWEGQCKDSHEYLDRTSETRNGIPVYTGDASGRGGGAHYKHLRLAWTYPAELAAGEQSSNYRELDTVVRPLKQWGRRWRRGRVLNRSDNKTSVSTANRGGTMQPNLTALSDELQQTCRELEIDLASIHIPGVQNKLADALSRFVRGRDTSDWMVHPAVFEQAQEAVRSRFLGGRGSFTLDGAADPVGNNAQLPRYCSVVDSVYDRDLAGEHFYANPDYEQIEAMLRHFLAAYHRAPETTSGTFVLPEWLSRPWWRLLRGAKVVARFPVGARLFTSPDWNSMQAHDGSYTYHPARVDRGPTRWPVLIVHYPTVLGTRREDQARGAGAGAGGAERFRGGRAGGTGLLTVSGDPGRDGPNLSRVCGGVVH